MFSGCIVALVTPFRDGKVDVARLEELVGWHASSGTAGIVVSGTTGESATLAAEEREEILRVALAKARGRVPVIAGTGSNDTARTIAESRRAKELGASAVLVVTPYYNRPTQQGLLRHYEAVARAVELPLILYNVPGRTGVSLAPETVARLAEVPGVVALKQASSNFDELGRILELSPLDVLSGEDALTVPMMALGAKGVISVLANVVPAEVSELARAALGGNWELARKLHFRLLPLCRALFLESNPIPVKAALAMMGKIRNELRLPLCPASPEVEDQLRKELTGLGVLQA